MQRLVWAPTRKPCVLGFFLREAVTMGDAPVTDSKVDLAAAFACEGQELFNRQRIRDPFGEPLGTRGLIFEILDRVQAPPPQKPRIWSRELFGQPWCLRSG